MICAYVFDRYSSASWPKNAFRRTAESIFEKTASEVFQKSLYVDDLPKAIKMWILERNL